MHYEEHPPAPDLARHVECLWVFEAERGPDRQRHHVIVPDGAVSVSCMTAPQGWLGSSLVGPADSAYRHELIEGAVYGGVRLRPGAAGSVLGLGVTELRNTVRVIDAASPPALRDIAAGMMEGATPMLMRLQTAARALVAGSRALDREVLSFAEALSGAAGGQRIAELADGASVGMRQLRRRFLYQCGVTPKLFFRLRRLRETCRAILASRAPDLSQAAVEAGFADQAHMTNEFTRVFGESAHLVVEYLATIRHGAFMRERA